QLLFSGSTNHRALTTARHASPCSGFGVVIVPPFTYGEGEAVHASETPIWIGSRRIWSQSEAASGEKPGCGRPGAPTGYRGTEVPGRPQGFFQPNYWAVGQGSC